MKSISQMSLGELAAYVCSHLEDKGIKVTLSGGGCGNRTLVKEGRETLRIPKN